MKQKLLRQKWSGHVFVWSEQLAARDDMEPYEPETPVQNPDMKPNKSGLDEAIEIFRAEVSKPRRKKDEQ